MGFFLKNVFDQDLSNLAELKKLSRLINNEELIINNFISQVRLNYDKPPPCKSINLT